MGTTIQQSGKACPGEAASGVKFDYSASPTRNVRSCSSIPPGVDEGQSYREFGLCSFAFVRYVWRPKGEFHTHTARSLVVSGGLKNGGRSTPSLTTISLPGGPAQKDPQISLRLLPSVSTALRSRFALGLYSSMVRPTIFGFPSRYSKKISHCCAPEPPSAM